MFICERCGLCCKAVSRSDIYKYLDCGDGSCRHLNKETNDCNIYNDRPLICRVDEAYYQWFHNQMSLEEYYQLNYKACRLLRNGDECNGREEAKND